MDRLSNILKSFNEQFGTLFTDTDRVAKRIRDDIAPKVADAAAPTLSGPWRRITMDGPVSRHTENPVVTTLRDGRLVAFFDGCGHHQKMGYMVSHDGRSWSDPILLDLDSHPDRWWALTRTPVGLIELDDGAFALSFTAYNRNFYDIPGIWSATSDSVFDGYFAGVGRLVLELVTSP